MQHQEIVKSAEQIREDVTSALEKLNHKAGARQILLPIRRSCQEFQSFVVRHLDSPEYQENISRAIGQLRGFIAPVLKELCLHCEVDFKKDFQTAKILKLPSTSKTRQKTKLPKRENPSSVVMNISGHGNVQVGGDYITTIQPPDKKILPPPDSIGADPLLKQRITTLFNQIGEQREKRFGGSAYRVMYSNFKNDFGIKNNKWTIIWTWPKECAPAIVNYLEEKYGNTIQGRIKKAASRRDYIHSRPHLYKREKELLEHLGLSSKSPEFRQLLKEYFGVDSHVDLSHLGHWQLVCYLESVVKKMEE
ncbi:MAG: hypothetical protein ACE5JU_20560 [Candidatus Binatia bacterium]